jgi:hypothetical protein
VFTTTLAFGACSADHEQVGLRDEYEEERVVDLVDIESIGCCFDCGIKVVEKTMSWHQM